MADPRTVLRDGTRAEHDRVDALLGRFDLSTRAGYARFLTIQARAFVPVEAVLAGSGIAALVLGWIPRTPALLADLAALGAPAPDPLPAPALDGHAAALGAWYVLEGSRLGGALLERGVAPGLPRAFLTQSGQKWAKSVELLNNRLYDPAELGRALGAARAVFALFERAAWEPS